MFVIVAATGTEIKDLAVRAQRDGTDGADALFDRLVRKHTDTEGAYVELRQAQPGSQNDSITLRSSIAEEEAGELRPYDVEDEDGEWHRILAPDMDVAERKAKRQGIRVSCIQNAEQNAEQDAEAEDAT